MELEFFFAARNIYAGFLIFVIPLLIILKMVKRSQERDRENARAAQAGAERYQAHLQAQTAEQGGSPTPEDRAGDGSG